MLVKIPLSVQLIVNAINNNKSQKWIAEQCNVTYQAVSDYKIRHRDEIDILLDKSDSLQILNHRLNIAKASGQLNKALDFEPTKKDIIPLVAVIDRLTPAYRLLAGQSTSNIDVGASISNLLHALEHAESGINSRNKLEIEGNNEDTVPLTVLSVEDTD